jgi:hypothetical protein
MMPRGIIGVFAMGRPRRPAEEAHLVRQAAADGGTAIARAARVAHRVAALTLVAVDEVGEEPVVKILRMLANDPTTILARDPSIDTAALIRIERARRCEARGGRRLPERDWEREDRETLKYVAVALTRRYRRYLSDR